ncbi:histidine phosphatase superfamily [Pilobolus umbonatus]|nr:histidine phosphatase superfamily [Pilobolus umbonatus]
MDHHPFLNLTVLIDTVLNKNGLRQAALCGERLQKENFDCIYSSDLTRCKQTTSAIATYHPNAPVVYQSALRERDFGGLSRQYLKTVLSHCSHNHISMDDYVQQHGGEREKVFRSRIVEGYESIIEDARVKQYERVLIVTHGGPLRHLTKYWIEQGYETVPTVIIDNKPQGNTAVTQLTMDNNTFIITEYNSMLHLSKEKETNQPPPAV